MKSLQEYEEMAINVKTYKTGKFLELLGPTIKYPEKFCYKKFTSKYDRYISLHIFWIMKKKSGYRLLNSSVSCTCPLFHIIIELFKKSSVWMLWKSKNDWKKWKTTKNHRTCKNVEQVRFVRSNRRFGKRLIAEELHLDGEAPRKTLTENVGMKKVSAKMVPKMLSGVLFRCLLEILLGAYIRT